MCVCVCVHIDSRGRARCVAPGASPDVGTAAWSGVALAVCVRETFGRARCLKVFCTSK